MQTLVIFLLSVAAICLAVFSGMMLLRAYRVQRACTCGAAVGSFSPVTDYPLSILQRVDRQQKFAKRWDDRTLAQFNPRLTGAAALRDDEV